MDRVDRVKEFASKLEKEWSLLKHKLNVRSGDALYKWTVPRQMTIGSLPVVNWAMWLGHVPLADPSRTTASDLLRFEGSDPSFFLWRHVKDEGRASQRCECVPSGQNVQEYAELLANQRMSQMLRDEVQGEPRVKLMSKDAAMYRLTHAWKICKLASASGDIDAIAVLGDEEALKMGFRSPNLAMERIYDMKQRLSARSIVYVEVMLSSRCAHKRTGLELMNHIYASFPNTLLCVHCPAVLGTIQLYADMGFRLDTLRSDDTNLINYVVDRLSGAVRVWHSGYTKFTYLTSSVEDSSARVSAYEGSYDEIVSGIPNAQRIVVDKSYHETLGSVAQKIERVIAEDERQVWMVFSKDVDDENWLVEVLKLADRLLTHTSTAMVIDSVIVSVPASSASLLRNLRLELLPPTPTLCTLDSPVHETLNGVGDARVEYEPHGMDLNDPMVTEDDPQYDQQYDQQDDPQGGSGGYVEFEDYEAYPLDSYVYSKSRKLKLTRVAEVVEHAMHRMGLKRRDMTADIKSLFVSLFGEVPPGHKGVCWTRDKVVTHAALYEPVQGGIVIKDIMCVEDDEASKLFALSLRFKGSVQVADGKCSPAFVSAVRDESIENVYEHAVSTDARRSFPRECLARLPNGRWASVCRGRSRSPVSRG